MELIKNLKYMCRICAVNIKKRRSSSSAVSIFETPQLTEKLKKYLNMDIIYNDELPKSICSVCFKKVEAIYALGALAKKTENFLNDFIKIAQNNLKHCNDPETYPISYQNEFNNFRLLDGSGGGVGGGCTDDGGGPLSMNHPNIEDMMCCDDDELPPPSQTISTTNEPEEVVLNFTLKDPLTKNIQKKIVVAKQKKQQREQKHFHQHQQQQQPLPSVTQQITDEILRELQTTIKRKERNNSLEQQKRQNLKMSTNTTSSTSSSSHNNHHHHQQQHQHSRQSPESINNFKVILPTPSQPPPPPSSSSSSHLNHLPTNLSHHNTNLQMQSSNNNPINYSTTTNSSPATQQFLQHQQSLLDSPPSSSGLIDNHHVAAATQMMNDCLNLGSVIKDMDLLKLILKALKWQYNEETLNSQINRLKNTRFRDVMIDPNLLQDTDLMQILSTYLSPMLLQQQSPPIPNNNSTTGIGSLSPPLPLPPPMSSLSASNILPPSVSYKIPAETSVRLVSVPRDEQQSSRHHQQHHHHHNQHHHQQQQSSHHHHHHHDQQQQQTSSSSWRKHSRSSSDRYEHNKSRKSSKSEQKQHRRSLLNNSCSNMQQQQLLPPPQVIVVSDDDDSYCSDNIQRFEVNVDPMLYFHGADSSLENSNESTMVTMGYFKQMPLNAEVTLQKRKKQKRSKQQPLKTNSTEKKNHHHQQQQQQQQQQLQHHHHYNREPDLLIVDDNGEKMKFSNEISCVPTSRMLNHPPIIQYSMPSTSTAKNFEFTTPKKKRRLNTVKSASSAPSVKDISKPPAPSSPTTLSINDFTKMHNLQTVVKVEKNLEDVSIIAVNKSYDNNTKKMDISLPPLSSTTTAAANVELISNNKKLTTEQQPLHSSSSGSSNKKTHDSKKDNQNNIKSVIEKIGLISNTTTVTTTNLCNKELENKMNQQLPPQQEKNEKSKKNSNKTTSGGGGVTTSTTGIEKSDLDDGDSMDTNHQLVIDENYDDEKLLKDEDIKIDIESTITLEENNLNSSSNNVIVEKELKSNNTSNEELEIKANESSNNDKSTDNSESTIDNMSLLRRSRRQTKIKEPFTPYTKGKTNKKTSQLTMLKHKTVSTRGKTRQQEEKSIMQTRNRNISQRGREQKPSAKYYKKRY